MGALSPVFLVRVVGPSMEPSIHNGELLLARRSTRELVPGQVVVLTNPVRPHLIEIKRLIRKSDGGWWVEGDNADLSTDSRSYGSVDPTAIRGVVLRSLGNSLI